MKKEINEEDEEGKYRRQLHISHGKIPDKSWKFNEKVLDE